MSIQLENKFGPSNLTKLYKGDRCDACGFQARFIASTKFGEFWFCGHDWEKFRGSLEDPSLTYSEQTFEDASRPRCRDLT